MLAGPKDANERVKGMSVQFGRWHFDGRPVDRDYLFRVGAAVASCGPDEEGCHLAVDIGIGFRAFHTNRESRRTKQPYLTPSGRVITWDGRLDNRADLVRDLRPVARGESDVEIVAAAYEKWGRECLARLIGDWALVIWDGTRRTLLLATDFIAARRLYYSLDRNGVSWSTLLDPLVLFTGSPLSLSEEYIAGWLCNFPAAQLTPYAQIHAVPPACLVLIENGKLMVSRYWEFDPGKSVRYPTDAEYEEHFRTLFAQSVRRRLRSDQPTVAELSGGMDSSAIVCVADQIMARGLAETPRLDTLSYYSDAEPNWDERPYFTIIEERRRQTGCHIKAEMAGPRSLQPAPLEFAAAPGHLGGSPQSQRQLADYVQSHRNRVLLSGIGGDEFLGGVPTPLPELADLLARGALRQLARRTVAWARLQRKPLLHLLGDTLRGFLPCRLGIHGPGQLAVPWLTPGFVRRNQLALQAVQQQRIRLFGPLPSFQENLQALEGVRRQLAATAPTPIPILEKSYPYLDRCLLEFLFAIPREQLVRPGERRSLMRRALVGTVPGEILGRRRKAFAVRTPMQAIAKQWSELTVAGTAMLSESLGIIDSRRFAQALEELARGRSCSIVPLARVLAAELWLRQTSGVSSSSRAERQPWSDIQDLKISQLGQMPMGKEVRNHDVRKTETGCTALRG